MATKKKSAAKTKSAKKVAKKAAPAAKKKKKKKPASAKGRSKGKKSGGGAWIALGLMLLVGAAVFAGMRMLKSQAEVIIEVKAQQIIGSAGKATGQLSSPRGIGVGPDGDIAVADLGNSRINVYGSDGTFKLTFGVPGDEGEANLPGQFREPSGVSIDAGGHFFVADAWNGRIQQFDPKGKFVQEFKAAPFNFYSPRNVMADKKGNLYVADTGNSQIKIFPISGSSKPIAVGGAGKGDGQFQEVFGLAMNDAGEIFATDPGNRRIHKFVPGKEPRAVKNVKVPGWKNNGPFWPHLALDKAGHVYVGDNINNKIWVFNSELEYVATLQGAGGQPVFGAPLGIAVLPDQSLVVADMNGSRLVNLGVIRFPVKP